MARASANTTNTSFNAAPHALRLLPSLTASPTLTWPRLNAPCCSFVRSFARSGASSSLSLPDAGVANKRGAARRTVRFFTVQDWPNEAFMVKAEGGARAL